jgi:hypothetical protein
MNSVVDTVRAVRTGNIEQPAKMGVVDFDAGGSHKLRKGPIRGAEIIKTPGASRTLIGQPFAFITLSKGESGVGDDLGSMPSVTACPLSFIEDQDRFVVSKGGHLDLTSSSVPAFGKALLLAFGSDVAAPNRTRNHRDSRLTFLRRTRDLKTAGTRSPHVRQSRAGKR